MAGAAGVQDRHHCGRAGGGAGEDHRETHCAELVLVVAGGECGGGCVLGPAALDALR